MAAAVAGPLVDVAIEVGVEAYNALNKTLKNRSIAQSWYGKDYETFTNAVPWKRAITLHIVTELKIYKVFTIRREDWPIVIKECLPVCHTWYNDHVEGGECSWPLIYRAVVPKFEEKRVLQNAESSFMSLGLVSSLPAARLDSWGLIVLAYTDGATTDTSCDHSGCSTTTLDAKHFVITVSGNGLSTPLVAHLQPKEHPDRNRKLLADSEITNLLQYGHSFPPGDSSIGWPLYGKIESQPPEELVDGRLNGHMKRAVLSHVNICQIRERHRKMIISYHGQLAKLEEEFDQLLMKSRSPKRVDGEQDPSSKDLQHFNKLCNVTEAVKKVKNHISTHVKLFTPNECEHTSGSVELVSAIEEDFGIAFTKSMDKLELGLNDSKDLSDTSKTWEAVHCSHMKLIAFEGMLNLCQRVPKGLSTRYMGRSVLLA